MHLRAAEPQIAWARRREIGFIRAYLRTANDVTFRTRRFAAEVVRPVDYRDAQRFRALTVALAFVPLLVGQGMFALSTGQAPAWLASEPWLLAPFNAGILLGLVFVTGVHSYGFHRKCDPMPLQNRAVALSYYAFGGLGLANAVGISAAVVIGPFAALSHPAGGQIVLPIVLIAQVLGFALSYWNLIGLARHTLRSARQSVAIAVVLPLEWAFLTAFAQLIVLGPCIYALMIYYSLGD